MTSLYYLGKPWQDNPEPPDPDDWDDDFEELPTHCIECGEELEAGQEHLCRGCIEEINRPPEPAPDSFLESEYDERNGDSEPY